MKKYLYKLLPIVFLINSGCSDQKIESSNNWTLYNDAEVISISPLIEGTQSSVRIGKGQHGYIVSILDVFQCGVLEEKLYLSLTRNGKLTLELTKPNRNVTTQPLGSSFPRRRESSDSAEYNFRIELDSRLRENDGVQSKGLNSYK